MFDPITAQRAVTLEGRYELRSVLGVLRQPDTAHELDDARFDELDVLALAQHSVSELGHFPRRKPSRCDEPRSMGDVHRFPEDIVSLAHGADAVRDGLCLVLAVRDQPLDDLVGHQE